MKIIYLYTGSRVQGAEFSRVLLRNRMFVSLPAILCGLCTVALIQAWVEASGIQGQAQLVHLRTGKRGA
ncbi:hypothetical protein DYI23_16985 [Roseibium polysiphoniae]|uniref:Uncharacterized protein n=1 Tax=Roseibium polysiphoniae TaxID=2571221 RepID=A0A944CEG4_9HYPH|nr:hypothetical protein [Roseibium polysiphoniae]